MARNRLKGLLVVSMEQAVAAPYCASRLADAGARVIKIERAEGDFARGYDAVAKGQSSYFVWLNRGKESLCRRHQGAGRQGAAANGCWRRPTCSSRTSPRRRGAGRLRLGRAAGDASAADHRRHLRLRRGRRIRRDEGLRPAGAGGIAASPTSPAMPAGPGRVGVSACDIACGMHAYAAVLEALIERGITGRGKGSQVSLFDGMADWMKVPLLQYEGTGQHPPRIGLAHPSICPYGAFATKDGAAGADLHPERARMGRASAPISWMSRRCRSARASATNNDRVAQPADGRCAYRRGVRRADARGMRGEAARAPTPPMASSTTARGCAPTPALRRVDGGDAEGAGRHRRPARGALGWAADARPGAGDRPAFGGDPGRVWRVRKVGEGKVFPPEPHPPFL